MLDSKKMECKLDNDDLDTLIYAIKQKNCILMLGPDTATETVDEKTYLLTESLASQLAEELEQKTRERINPSDLAQVSQYYAEKGRLRLESKASNFYKKKHALCNQLHQNLAKLPFYFTITTTPDSMLINALEKEKKLPIMGLYNFKGKNPEPVQMGTVEKPLVFYLYGSVTEPNSLLLTENDLLDFLAGLISGKPPLPNNIRIELQDENKIFLFLGFGFRHWYLRILLYALQGKNKISPSIALEKFPLENTIDLEHTVFFFNKSDYKIHIFKEDFNIFAATLLDRYWECSSVVVLRKEAENMPEVFLCHASEDKDHAAFLYKELEQAGIRPWLDRENLRGGDHWDEKIRDTIKKIDYFVVLQSQTLNNKDRGYVTREINRAIDRLEEFPRGKYVFIIPVKIEDCPLREDLEKLKLHAIDLTDKGNMKKLIDIIQRDFQKRKKLDK